MKKMLLAILIFSCFAFSKCNKGKKTPPPDNPYGLPNATQTGKNIFACRVNGENWISEKGMYKMRGGVSDTSFGVHGSRGINNTSGEQYEIGIIGTFVLPDTAYRLNDTARQFSRYWGLNVSCFVPNGGYNSVTAMGFDGEVILTKIDRTNRILSGNFWFNIETGFCDTMKVTDGRFDIRY